MFKLATLTRQGEEKIHEFVKEEIAGRIQRYWRGNLEDNQQYLAEDINIYDNNQIIQIGSKNEILKFLEWGTAPHIIKPDEAQALRWFNDEGEPVFATEVRHPGTDPQAHMRNSIDRVRTEVSQ